MVLLFEGENDGVSSAGVLTTTSIRVTVFRRDNFMLTTDSGLYCRIPGPPTVTWNWVACTRENRPAAKKAKRYDDSIVSSSMSCSVGVWV